MDYDEAWRTQLAHVVARDEGRIPDTVLFVEHPPVITLGRKSPESKTEGFRAPPSIDGVPVHMVERGGEATFHGPGQVVVYPILRLNAEFGPKSLLRAMEEAIIAVLATYKIRGYWIEGKTGVWVKDKLYNERKIASLGIAVRKGVSYHGLALNVVTDLNFFRLIQPCGFAPAVMTTMAEVRGKSVDMQEIKERLEIELALALAPLYNLHPRRRGPATDATVLDSVQP